MRRDVSNRLIGLFVLIAIAILFVFVMMFGVGKYFQEEKKFVLYFDASLHGLKVGAPVEFKGVQVGEVEEIRVELNQKTRQLSSPVVISVLPHNIIATDVMSKKAGGQVLKELIDKGLYAELKVESLLTGSLYIELDSDNDRETKFSSLTNKLEEIPTVESKSEQLSGIITSAQNTLKAIEDFVESDKLNQSIDDLSKMMQSGRKAAESADVAMQDGRQAIEKFDKFIEPIANRLIDTLNEFPDMISAIRVFVDYLSRHPEALLKGKS